mgnify:CR=1 FL=1
MNKKIEKIPKYLKDFLIGISVILIYLFLPYLEVPLLEIFNINPNY